MNYIEIAELEVGQTFSEPVYMEGDHILVPAGAAIRERELEFIKSLGITELYTEGHVLLSNMGVKAGGETESGGGAEAKPSAKDKSPAHDEYDFSEPYTKLDAYIKHLDMLFKEIASKPTGNMRSRLKVSVRQLWAVSAALLKLVKEERSACLSYILLGNKKNSIAKSSVNTVILSILMAKELDINPQRFPEIAAGALLHDIGMLRLPENVVKKQGRLSAAEISLIKTHTTFSFQIITQELAYSKGVGTIALQHHERWDGTGYPYGLAGQAIDMGARIVSVADAFEAMVSQKSFRDPLIGYLAMKNLVAENASHFSPNVLKSFVKIMGMYPIGSGVSLNDGRIARVIDVEQGFPLRPVIKIIAETGAKKVKNGEIIHLNSDKKLYILQAIDISRF